MQKPATEAPPESFTFANKLKTEQALRQLDALEGVVHTTLRRLADLQRQLETVKAENEKLRETVARQTEEIKNFQNSENITKIVGSMAAADAGNTAELKWKINEYIRKIDKCIAHLKE